MGDIKRKRKKYRRPKKLFDIVRIQEENELAKKYGLKNKREIWKAGSQISTIRRRAKTLIPKSEEEKEKFFKKLNNLGFSVANIADVLNLTKEDWFNRRLQTFVFKKNLAHSPEQARQLIVHKHILVNNNIVNIPSFIVTKELENKVTIKSGNKTKKETKENGE